MFPPAGSEYPEEEFRKIKEKYCLFKGKVLKENWIGLGAAH